MSRALKQRVRILRLIASRDPSPSFREIKVDLGLSSVQTVAYHVGKLKAENLVISHGGAALDVTVAGQVLLGYVDAVTTSETLMERWVRTWFGVYRHTFARLVQQVAIRLDQAYKLRRDQARRRSPDGGTELERKVTACQILAVFRRNTVMESAAADLGLASGALHQRAVKLFSQARAEREEPATGHGGEPARDMGETSTCLNGNHIAACPEEEARYAGL